MVQIKWLCLVVLCLVSIRHINGRPREEVNKDNQDVEQPTNIQPAVGQEDSNNERTKDDHHEDENVENVEEESNNDHEEEHVNVKKEITAADLDEKKIKEISAPLNVHDAMARQAADQIKMKFTAGEPEVIMHGGHHVHAGDKPTEPIGVRVDSLVEMMEMDNKKEEDDKLPSTLDTEELMHEGEDGHGHNPHDDEDGHKPKEEVMPSANNPEDLLHIRDEENHHEELRKKSPGAANPEEAMHGPGEFHGDHKDKAEDNINREKLGIDIEEVVHGDGHAHDHDEVTEEYEDEDGIKKTRKLGKEITFEDVQQLGLSKDDLEGVDLKRLLRRDKSEYNAWKNEKQNEVKDESFWEKVESFRANYFDMLSSQIRHLSRSDDDDDPEWENDLLDDEPHPGESRVDHESELWGSTNNKANRKRRTFTVLHRPTHDGTEEL